MLFGIFHIRLIPNEWDVIADGNGPVVSNADVTGAGLVSRPLN
jgi:hypothetical protein